MSQTPYPKLESAIGDIDEMVKHWRSTVASDREFSKSVFATGEDQREIHFNSRQLEICANALDSLNSKFKRSI